MPTSQDEISWFVTHITEELRSVTTKQELLKLWTSNATSIAALPDEPKAQIIALKDSIKMKVV